MNGWTNLVIAIMFEIVATYSTKVSDGFTKFIPSAVSVVGYGLSAYFFSLALKEGIDIAISYAIWSALGIVFISIIGWFAFKQSLDFFAVLGITLIIMGTLVINLFSKNWG